MSFPTIRNPLLPSPPSSKKKPGKLRRSEFFSNLQLSAAASLKPSISTDSLRNFVSQTIHQISGNTRTNKKIMPSGMPKSATMVSYSRHPTMQEPLVHYNGPQHTLEELPVEKLNWIKEDQLNNVLQVIATDSSKVRSFRCTVQVNDETCAGSFVTSEKSGKNGSIVQFDETFLFDIEDPTTATFSVFAKNRSMFGQKQQEQCLGKESIQVGLNYKQKSAERFVLNDNPSSGQSNDYQLLVVHGTYVSRRSQILLNNTVLFEDYITAHIHSGQSQRWERFWGVLHATQFELYDFEYKGNKPPLYVVPLDQFINVASIEEDEDDNLADIGSRGLVLEFTSKALDKEERRFFTERESGCRMFLLPESTASAREWKDKLNYSASIFEELGEVDQYDNDSLYSFDDQEIVGSRPTVPSKLLW